MSAPVVVIDWLGGNCPVQAEGTVNGEPFYFRARGCWWSMSIGQQPVDAPNWHFEQEYGKGPYDAGWMPEDEARGFIAYAAQKWADEKEAAE